MFLAYSRYGSRQRRCSPHPAASTQIRNGQPTSSEQERFKRSKTRQAQHPPIAILSGALGSKDTYR